MEKLSPKFISDLREFFEKDFYWAAKVVLEATFENSWLEDTIHRNVCQEISDFEHNKRLAICLPRGWLKSQIASIYYPIWRAMKDPRFSCFLVFNTFTNATKKLKAVRSIIKQNPFLPQMYPERMPDSTCEMSEEAITLPRPAGMSDATFSAAGVGTQLTSRHARLIVEDDTIAPEYDSLTGSLAQPSPEQVEKSLGFHKSSHFLLQDFENDQRLVIGTRWLERDLFSEIVANEPQYKVIMRAVKEDEQGRPAEGGRLTYPRRFSQKVLDEIRQSVGEYMYQTLMMNNPIGGEAMIFHERDFNYYETPPSELWTTITVDPAASDERNSSSSDPDYNVVLVAGIDASTGYIYVLDYFRARCNPGRVIDEIFRLVNIYDPVKVGIESVSYQKTLKYWVTQRQLAEQRFFQIEEIPNSKMKKVHRIRGLQPLFENRRIFLKSWMVELKGELLAFDRGAHDDLADALAMQLETLRHIEVPKVLQTEYVADLNKGASLIQELRGRFSRPKKFPYDMGPAWERQDWTPRVGVN